MRGIVFLVAIVCWTSAAYGQNCARPQDVVLAPVNIVDVERGTVRYSRALFLSGGRIVRESASTRVPGSRWRRAALINGYDAYVIPGLWDMHVHALWDTDFNMTQAALRRKRLNIVSRTLGISLPLYRLNTGNYQILDL